MSIDGTSKTVNPGDDPRQAARSPRGNGLADAKYMADLDVSIAAREARIREMQRRLRPGDLDEAGQEAGRTGAPATPPARVTRRRRSRSRHPITVVTFTVRGGG
jgi:hypothetical protein